MFSAPIASLVFMILGSGFFMSFVSLYFKEVHLGEFHIGLAQSSLYAGLLASSLWAERLIARIGHIRALTATCGLFSAVTLILYFVPPAHWFWFRFIAGACVGCFYVGVESWLLEEYPANKRGQALAVYTAALYLAQSLSQLFLRFTHAAPHTAFAISALCISLAVVPVSLARGQGPELKVSEAGSFFTFIRFAPLGVTACFLSGTILSTLYTFMPLYAEARAFDPGRLMMVLIMGGALLQWPIGKMSDKFDRTKVLLALAISGALVALTLSLVAEALIFHLLVFILGGIFFAIYPIAMALGCDCIDNKDLVKMTGVLLFAYGVGAVVGPLVTPIAKGLGQNYMVVMLVFFSVLLFLTGLYTLSTRKRISLAEQSRFAVIPTGPVVEELQPSVTEQSGC